MNRPSATPPGAMLAAGGTAGHLFPAFALAQELGRRGIGVDLMTDMRGDRYGADFPARHVYQVSSATVTAASPLSIVRTAVTLGRGAASAYGILRRVRPAMVIGFGGYPTLPPLLAARLRGIPTALHEQNAVLGRANRLLSRSVTAIATSFEQTRFLGAERASRFTGNPVRDAVLQRAGTPYRTATAGEPFRLLVFGGSQGARFFSDAVPPALAALSAELKGRLQVVQQCREEDLARVRKIYSDGGISAELATFFAGLPELMASAHLVIGRAGASSVAELSVLGRPSLLVPLPHALDNDQLQNATRLAEAGAAWCIAQRDLTTDRLTETLVRLMSSPDDLAKAAAAAKTLGRPDAAARLADLVEELMARLAPHGASHAPASVVRG